jgi:hypothetical protein
MNAVSPAMCMQFSSLKWATSLSSLYFIMLVYLITVTLPSIMYHKVMKHVDSHHLVTYLLCVI